MQNKKYNLESRARYYQSTIDNTFIEPGTRYNEFPYVVIIYILTFDYKGYGEAINIDRTYTENHYEKAVEDKRMVVYMNATAKSDNEELNAFYKFLLTNQTTTKMTEEIDKVIIETNKSPIYRRQQMIVDEKFEDMRKEAIQRKIQQGIQQGIEQGIQSTAKNLLQMGMSEDDISKATGLSIEKIKSIKNS